MIDFEQTFSAYQHKEAGGGSGGISTQYDTLKRRSRAQQNGERPKELSLIDGRRAQNLNILLSRYKLSEEDIRSTVMRMDPEGRLDKDMVEQLIKYVPTFTEKELLESHVHESSNFARADRFMLVTSRCVLICSMPCAGEQVTVMIISFYSCTCKAVHI